MVKKLFILVSILAATACVRETYDMDRLSKRAHLSPTLAVSAVRGDISFSDIIEPSDTVIFDEDNFVRLVLKEDSVIDLRMEDYYDLNDMVNFKPQWLTGIYFGFCPQKRSLKTLRKLVVFPPVHIFCVKPGISVGCPQCIIGIMFEPFCPVGWGHH